MEWSLRWKSYWIREGGGRERQEKYVFERVTRGKKRITRRVVLLETDRYLDFILAARNSAVPIMLQGRRILHEL